MDIPTCFFTIFSSPGRSPEVLMHYPRRRRWRRRQRPHLRLSFFNGLYFPNHTMDLVHIWYDNMYRSSISCHGL